jgi:hypothetical protein
MAIVPLFVQVAAPAIETLTLHPKVPVEAYTWVGFWWVELLPSPKFQAYDGKPAQLLGVAVAWKDTDEPTATLPGTLAAQLSVHGPLLVTWKV